MNSFYTLNHLLISRQDQRGLSGLTREKIDGLNVAEIEPDAKTVRYWVEQVGGPYGWADREQYTIEAIEQLITKPGTRLFVLEKGTSPIGYCLIHGESEYDLRSHFNKAGLDVPANANITRIEGFGIKQAHTQKNYGDFFLQSMFEILFDRGESDYVYLTSRSTNHPKVVPFYRSNGMQLIDRERKAEDRPQALIVSSASPELRQSSAKTAEPRRQYG